MNFIDRRLNEQAAAYSRATTEHTRGKSHVKVLLKPGGRAEQIVNALKEWDGQSRASLHKTTGISEQSLCGRLNELIKLGYIELGGVTWNAETARNVVTYWMRK